MQIQDLPEFYELHLILLSIFCLLSLLADRYAKTRQTSVDERPGSGNSSSLATLTRQYLVVYGIVMGSSYIIILTAG
jgi:MFS transporter, MFS domain-containing protein family, molybdate-anion transporter